MAEWQRTVVNIYFVSGMAASFGRIQRSLQGALPESLSDRARHDRQSTAAVAGEL